MKLSRNNWQKTFYGMPNSKKYWKIFEKDEGGIIQTELYYRHWLNHRKDGCFIQQMEDFVERFNMNKQERMKDDLAFFIECVSGRKIDPMDHEEKYYGQKLTTSNFKKAAKALKEAMVPDPHYISLGNCTQAATPYVPTPIPAWGLTDSQQEQGNNPMAYDTKTTSAVASIINAASDEAKQRDFLMEEFNNLDKYAYRDLKFPMLRKLFNLDALKYPDGSQALLDAFKNGRFTVDQKKVDVNTKLLEDINEDQYDDEDQYVGEKFYGITFTDLPVPDQKGYEAAVKAYEEAKKATKRKIIIGSPAEGLAALEALEAWMPETKTAVAA